MIDENRNVSVRFDDKPDPKQGPATRRTLAAELRRLRRQHEALVRKHASINDHPFCWLEHVQHRALLREHINELQIYLKRVRKRNASLSRRILAAS